MRRAARTTCLAAALLAAALAPAAPAAAAEEPLVVPWTDALPALPLPPRLATVEECRNGRIGCVDRTLAAMERRFRPLAEACDHDAPFALVYLRTTEEYRRAATAGLFADTAFVNRQDVVFAEAYFTAYDAWHGGQRAAVPPAWRLAFEAADARRLSATGDLLLGVNAHVNRDLPFVFEALGLVAPDGTSRKADHDRVNRFLARVYGPALEELAGRFDASADDASIDGTNLDETVLLQMLTRWREQAWRNAERLVTAGPLRPLVAASIEQEARLEGELIAAATAYVPPVTSSAPRASHCQAAQDPAG